MKAFVEIELFGENVRQSCKLYSQITNDLVPGLGDDTFDKLPPSGWVAELTGFDPKYKYTRKFLKHNKDYSRANSKGSRGIFAEYILESGKIYDIKDDRLRYFARVTDNGDVKSMSESEVKEWVKSHLE